jgi:hypothetical protein
MPSWTDEHRHRIACIATSYAALTGRDLIPPSHDIAHALWIAPAAIVAHGIEPDPIFFFGNETALRLFEMSHEAFTRLPSRLSAEPLARDERARLLAQVTQRGIIEDYAGIRISATGRRFRIANAAVWNLTDAHGHPAGQAASFTDWHAVAENPNAMK